MWGLASIFAFIITTIGNRFTTNALYVNLMRSCRELCYWYFVDIPHLGDISLKSFGLYKNVLVVNVVDCMRSVCFWEMFFFRSKFFIHSLSPPPLVHTFNLNKYYFVSDTNYQLYGIICESVFLRQAWSIHCLSHCTNLIFLHFRFCSEGNGYGYNITIFHNVFNDTNI